MNKITDATLRLKLYTVSFSVAAFLSELLATSHYLAKVRLASDREESLPCKQLKLGSKERKEEGRTTATNNRQHTPCERIINYRRSRFALREALREGRPREGMILLEMAPVLFRRSLITEQSARELDAEAALGIPSIYFAFTRSRTPLSRLVY